MTRDQETVELLVEVRQGDRAKMERLASLVWGRVYPFVFRTTLDHDLAEDIVQETLLVMVSRLNTLRQDRRFWPWIYRIAWNQVQDRLRNRRLQSTRIGTVLCESASDRHDSVLDAQVRKETLQQVSLAIRRLSRQQQDVLQLRCYEQLPYTEIASRTSTTPARARLHFHRAKKSLKKHLACCL